MRFQKDPDTCGRGLSQLTQRNAVDQGNENTKKI